MDTSMKKVTPAVRPRGILIVAILMILFGVAEVLTGFTHNFIGLVSTTQASMATYLGVTLGAFYSIGGVLILTTRKWAIAAIVLLALDVTGRIAMVLTGLYPLDSVSQTIAILIGTAIAAFFAIYIGLKLKFFR